MRFEALFALAAVLLPIALGEPKAYALALPEPQRGSFIFIKHMLMMPY
jgi:hypothetical protein